MLKIALLIIVLVAVLVCMAIATVYVYKDAKKRKMNEKIWAVVAFVVPFFIGVIVYFTIREPIVTVVCPDCEEELDKNAKVCGKCNTVLMTNCDKCDFPVKAGWRSCPNCGNELPEKFNQPITKYRKDSGIIPVAIIIGVLGLAFAAVCWIVSIPDSDDNGNTSSTGYGGHSGMYNITEDDMAGNSHIKEWIEKAKKDESKVSVLLSKTSGTCIVYVKDNDALLENSIDLDYTWGTKNGAKYEEFIATLYLTDSQYEDKYGYDFLMYEMQVWDDVEFTAYLDEEKQDVSVTYTDGDISMDTWEVE